MTARNLWRAALLVWLCWGIALLLGGCGGGDCPPDDARCDDASTQPVDCTANPKACV